MKKLLFALGAISLTAVASTSVVACSSGVSISKLTLDGSTITGVNATPADDNSLLADNATIKAAVDAVFKASDDATIKAAVVGTDYTINPANPTVKQAAGPLEFTVTGKGSLSGSFKFTVTLGTATFGA